MVDLTIVTCLAPCLAAGRDFAAAAAVAEPLLAAGLPTVVYVDEPWEPSFRARFASDAIRAHPTSPRRRRQGIAQYAELEAAWANAPTPERPGLDELVARLSRMGMLHDQSIWNPFGTRYLVWIDADVPASVHHRYLGDERLLEALPCLLRRFLFLVRPGAIADPAGVADASRVQGQLFGGELGEIPHANALYYQLLDERLRQQMLPSDEALFTHMLDRDPGRFDRVILQDNGLLGALFEAMRQGRVPVERTAYH